MSNARIVRDEFLCSGRRVSLYKRIIQFGEEYFEKDLVVFGSAVVVLPLLHSGEVIFVKQWRAAVNSWVLELPAGRIDDGESPQEAAVRELEEETGYRAGYLGLLARVYVAPGYSDETQWIFLARDLEYVGAKPEKGEIISTVFMKPSEFIDTALRGGYTDLKSLAAILLYMNCHHG
ncbi:MAG: NUDIX hydrolase [Ignisphaera sp.]|nr:NUDIX hydrolase [Ignisphaera sp.]MCX8168335.1 NUDIX hydrolase [Ignisphaera sp.]MDW8085332.1 NUDIX hydrolase [Ignisphaera sp.]